MRACLFLAASSCWRIYAILSLSTAAFLWLISRSLSRSARRGLVHFRQIHWPAWFRFLVLLFLLDLFLVLLFILDLFLFPCNLERLRLTLHNLELCFLPRDLERLRLGLLGILNIYNINKENNWLNYYLK